MNKISLQIIKELTMYNDADFKVLQGRLSLGMYGSDVSQEVAQHVADESQRRKLNDADAALPEVSPTWEVDLELALIDHEIERGIVSQNILAAHCVNLMNSGNDY